MAKVKWDGAALLAPVPAAIVTCGNDETVNALTIAWTGIINSKPPRTYISVRPQRYSYNIIKQTGEFTINLTTKALAAATDYCGVVSGAKTDKIKKLGLKLAPGQEISVPSLEDSPVSLECRVFERMALGSHDMFMADILCVTVNEELLSGSGRLSLEKAGLIAYAHGSYFELGAQLGTFGYTVRKKK